MTGTFQDKLTRFFNSNKIPLLVFLLTIIAAAPRLYHLGDLGFYMDEETTAFASRSMAETGKPQMPSGMPYYRSLPHTWLNATSAKIFGLNNELSYRLPGALLGILTIPLLFLLARPYTGTSIAFLAALLLALSEWHVITSRQARMYAPFLFFYVACSFSLLQWAKKDTLTHLFLAILLFITAANFHNLGVFLAFIPLIALFIKDYASTAQYKLFLFSIIAGVATYLYGEIIIGGPYEQWKQAYGIATSSTNEESLLQKFSTTGLQLTQAAIGVLLGIWLAIKSTFIDDANGKEFRILARYSLAILTGSLAALGHLYGAVLAFLLLLLLYPEPLNHYLQKTWKACVAISIVAASTAVFTIVEYGISSGIKSLLMFPYPNWITLSALSPGITLLFILALLYLASIKKSDGSTNMRILLLVGLFPIILVGIFMKWAAARYLLQAYPFILIVCAYVLYTPLHKFFQQKFAAAKNLALLFSILIILSGFLGGHGLVSAYNAGTITYGDKLNEAALIFPFYPDHKSPGEFVLKHRKAGDIVIAEDALEQRWYAGKIDYWLRKYGSESGGRFLYKGQDQKLHDIYVGSVVATTEILHAVTNNKNQRIWLITSGESYQQRNFYLRKDQQQWLEKIESTQTPVYTGQDKITRVYCLNCASN